MLCRKRLVPIPESYFRIFPVELPPYFVANGRCRLPRELAPLLHLHKQAAHVQEPLINDGVQSLFVRALLNTSRFGVPLFLGKVNVKVDTSRLSFVRYRIQYAYHRAWS